MTIQPSSTITKPNPIQPPSGAREVPQRIATSSSTSMGTPASAYQRRVSARRPAAVLQISADNIGTTAGPENTPAGTATVSRSRQL